MPNQLIPMAQQPKHKHQNAKYIEGGRAGERWKELECAWMPATSCHAADGGAQVVAQKSGA